MKNREKERRWRFLTNDTLDLMGAEVNEFAVFLVRHMKTMAMFVTLLVTAAITHWAADLLMDGHPSLKPTALVLDAVGFVCLLVDCLWLTNVVVPWVPVLQRWIQRQGAGNGA